jgi:hypothetical protein
MTGYEVGQEVRVFEHRRGVRNPDDGYPGTVTKVGRKYGTAEYDITTTNWNGEPHVWHRSVVFCLDSGTERDGGSYAVKVRTPAQVAEDQRRSAALSVIKSAGIEFRIGRERRFTLEQVEALAEVVKGWDGAESITEGKEG